MEFAAWQEWFQNNTVVILLVIGLAFWLLIRLSNLVWMQHKDLEKSELGRVADELKNLVKQIEFLFQRHDKTLEVLEEHGDRLGKLEARVKEQYARCTEREKRVDEQFKNSKKFFGGHRISDADCVNPDERCD